MPAESSSQLNNLNTNNMSAAIATADVTIAPAAPFTTSFLRDGATGKSYAIIHFGDANKAVSYTVYERESPSAISSSFLSGCVNDKSGAAFTFPITKGSTYFVIVKSGEESLSWTVDPNKRRVAGGASSSGSKKRAADGEPVAASDASAAAAAPAAAPAAAAAASAAPAAAEKKDKSPAKKEKKAKATPTA